MIFVPRLDPPNKGNPYYNTIGSGGYNPSVIGNIPRGAEPEAARTGKVGLNVLPNCTGYATGRFNEIIGAPDCAFLGRWMAYYMPTVAKRQGLKVIDHPVLGGVMCWKGGPSGSGHVACVEELKEDGSIITSESEWNGLYFTLYRRYPGADRNWRSGCYWMGASYVFQGCIVNPALGEDCITMNDYEKFCACMDEWLRAQRNKPASTYAEPALNWAQVEGIMKGDISGNLMPQSFVSRQDLAVMLQRALTK